MDDPETFMADLRDLLGLPDDAAADDVMDAVRTLIDGAAERAGAGGGEVAAPGTATMARAGDPDPARFVPIAAVRDLMARRGAEAVTGHRERIARKVEDAFRAGHITAAMRPWATALCASDESSFDDFVGTTGATFAYLSTLSHTAGPAPSRAGEPAGDERAIFAQLGIAPGEA